MSLQASYVLKDENANFFLKAKIELNIALFLQILNTSKNTLI